MTLAAGYLLQTLSLAVWKYFYRLNPDVGEPEVLTLIVPENTQIADDKGAI